MKGAVIGGLLAAVTDVVVNIVSDNYTNPIAWGIFFIVVVIAAMVGYKTDKSVTQIIKTIGKDSEIEQSAKNSGNQKIKAKGDNIKIKQHIE